MSPPWEAEAVVVVPVAEAVVEVAEVVVEAVEVVTDGVAQPGVGA